MKIIGNPSQWEAISHARGPCEVIAGPGSGKTFVLVHHILYLLQDLRADPSQILVLTFSKAAAKDMRRRFYHDLRSSYNPCGTNHSGSPRSPDDARDSQISDESKKIHLTDEIRQPVSNIFITPESASQITFGTFHSIFYRILQSSSRTNLKIIDEKTHTRLLRFLAKEYMQAGSGLDGSADRIVMEELAGAITHAKNRADQGLTHACEPSNHDSRSSDGSSFEDKIPISGHSIHGTISSGMSSLRGRKSISENSIHESTSSGGSSSAVQMPVFGKEKPQYVQAVALYNRYLRENGLMDYDDIVLECRRLFIEHPDVLALWRERFRYILIDEFQDINSLQYDVVKMLAGGCSRAHLHRNNRSGMKGDINMGSLEFSPHLFVVGDDDQSIYGFRGADPSIMQDFMKDYPDARRICLGVNYRSGSEIVRASGKVISANTNRIAKEVTPNRGSEGPVAIRYYPTAEAQYGFITDTIKRMSKAERAGCAVIVRTNRGAGGIQRAFEAAGLSTDRSRMDQKRLSEICEDILAYLAIGRDAHTGRIKRSDLYRIMNRPQRWLLRDIAPESIVDVRVLTKLNSLSESSAQEKLILSASLPESGTQAKKISRGTFAADPSLQSCQNLRDLLQDAQRLWQFPPALSVRYLRKSVGYEGIFSGQDAESAKEILDGIEAMAAGAGSVEALQRRLGEILDDPGKGDFLHLISQRKAGYSQPEKSNYWDSNGEKNNWQQSKSVTLCGNCDDHVGDAEKSPDIRIPILTMHAAKGLEFDTVFLPDLNEGIIPSRKSTSPEAIEEERRLLYVAMTRAKRRLELLYIAGGTTEKIPTRFIRVLGAKDAFGE